MGNHTTLKANGNLHFVPFFKELASTAKFRIEITLINNWAQSNFFHGHNALFFALLFLFLLVLKFELTVVHNFRNRRFSLRLNENQVHISVVRKCLRFTKWFDTQLFALKTD
ncbi:Uncharacterised protein [Mycobacteroides abscessus subsp. abscessus]|nr:Uncharacterised protein [Mycobacteroides abscessus subsp. abscessus]